MTKEIITISAIGVGAIAFCCLITKDYSKILVKVPFIHIEAVK